MALRRTGWATVQLPPSSVTLEGCPLVLVQRYGLDIAADPAIMGKKYSLSYSLTLNRSGELVLFIFEGISYSELIEKKPKMFFR